MKGFRPKPDPVKPHPAMPEVGNEFEERWVACDFQLVFGQVAQQNFASLKDTYEFVYRKAFIAGRSRRELEKTDNDTLTRR